MNRSIRWIFGAVATVGIVACIVLWLFSSHVVLRLSTSFYPDVIQLEKGDSVRFINLSGTLSSPAAGPHPTHNSYAAFDAKEGIAPWGSWKFTFDQEGVYTFHDHYAPQIHGIVVVGREDISKITEQETCAAIEDHNQQASCIEIYFRNVSETEDYLQARAIYEDIAPRYPNSCHSFAHDLGKNAYMAYLNNALPEIGQEASSCAYGLWHGFTTAMHADRGFASSKEFCATMDGATDDLRVINRMNCYHGIGIGLIPDPPPPHLQGEFELLVDPAIEYCDTIPGDRLYRERCLTGVFHAMTSYMNSGLHGFIFDEDSLHYCSEQREDRQFECFITLVSALPKVTKSFDRTIEVIQKYSPNLEIFRGMVENAAIMSVDMAASPEEMGHFVAQCDTPEENLRTICINAVVNNIYSNGMPGIEYQKAIAFCAGSWVWDTEKEGCYSRVIAYARQTYAPERVPEVCADVPAQIRSAIPECSRV